MDINAKKVEIIQHILIINDPETLRKIDRLIHGLDYKEDDGDNPPNKEKDSNKGSKRVNVIGSKIKSMLNMYDK